MSIISSEIINKGIQVNGKTLIQYRMTDNLGTVHVTPTRAIHPLFDIDADLLIKIAHKEEELIESELEEYFAEINANRNPFNDDQGLPVTPKFQTRLRALRVILRRVLKLSKQDVVRNIPAFLFLSNISDSQLKSILTITNIQVATIRSRQADVLEMSTRLNRFTPVL